MEKVRQIRRQLLRSRRLPWLVIGLTLLVLAGAILAACLGARQRIREQIVERDGETLSALAQWQQKEDEAAQDTLGPIDDPAEQFDLLMKISRLKGVLGVRLFTAEGVFTNAFPAYIVESTLPAADLARLKTLQPVSHFNPVARLSSIDLLAQVGDTNRQAPLLEVNVPLHAGERGRLAGVGQFLFEGSSIAREYARLDENMLLRAGGAAFLAAGSILTVALLLAFRQLQRMNELLSERTGRLSQANQELVLAAKTSAVGAVTSHLIHGLKNPLSGLQGFVKNHVNGTATESDTDWQDAMATTQRMQTLIGGVVRILEEQQAAGNYEISLRELVEIVSAKMLPVGRAAGVHFYTQVTADGMLSNRDANLTILILENLVQNAFQAAPEGKSVRLIVARSEGRIFCEVQDEGPGFPAQLRERLFMPCRSSKPGGSGIGLAISKQLATQIGATLELKNTSPGGCTFRILLPERIRIAAKSGLIPVQWLETE